MNQSFNKTALSSLSLLIFILFIFGLSSVNRTLAQYKIENHAVGTSKQDSISRNTNYRLHAVIGQPIATTLTEGAVNSAALGMYSFYLKQPNMPIVSASQGDFPDRVDVSWKFDVLSPPADAGQFEIYRDGVLLATLPRTQTNYQDLNVYPGKYYLYEIVGQNEFGKSVRGANIGFVNPNGTITGVITTQFGRPVYDVEVSVTPTLGKAMRFNSASDYLDAGDSLNLANTHFSIEFWLKRNNSGGNFNIFRQNPALPQVNSGIVIRYGSNNTFEFGFTGNTVSTVIQNDNEWHHYACIYDPQRNRFYVYLDGVLRASQAPANGTVYTRTGRVWLGGATENALYSIDEMRVWNVPLDSGAIKKNMRRTVNTNAANLISYWKFDEGIGDLAFDLSPNRNNGKIFGPVFSDDRAPVRTSGFTDLQGVYIIEGINYGTSTNFSVTPSRTGRTFAPPARVITLSSSNTSANNVDFVDISTVPVTGYVLHDGSQCYVDSVEILVNGQSMSPPIYTNSSGQYVVEFEPGSSQTIRPRRTGYSFNPAFRTFENVTDPIANVLFTQSVKREFSGKVAGGDCLLPIGPVKVTLEAIGGSGICRTDTLTTDHTGAFNFTGLSPMRYRVLIEPTAVRPWIQSRGDTVDLRDTSKVKNYKYYAPISVAVEGLPDYTNCNGPNGPFNARLLQQFAKMPVRYRVFEAYPYNGVTLECLVDTAEVKIYNGFADSADVARTVQAVNGYADDMIMTMYPNILAPHTKTFQVTAKHRDGRDASFVTEGIVTGVKPRSGSFVTTSPAIPLLILRDPPGDQSYAYVSNTNSSKVKWSMFGQASLGGEFKAKVSLAPTFVTQTGMGFSVTNEIKAKLELTTTTSYSFTGKNVYEFETEFSTTEIFKTSDGQTIAGDQGDVIVGAAVNFTYALTDKVDFDPDSCKLKKSVTITFAPTGFNTTYIYTVNYINNVLIPTLVSMDSLNAANQWRKILQINDRLKHHALFSENISFSAGTSTEYIKTTSSTETDLYEMEMTLDQSIGFEAGLEINGLGGSAGFTAKFGLAVGGSYSNSTTTTNTIGYSFGDDDAGDAFSVNVFQDLVYGTPVFKTVSGQSSCPAEPNTEPRDNLQLGSNAVVANNVHPDSAAVFVLNFGNINNRETREYQLRVLNESNPNGAVIAVNGIILQQGVNFNVGPGSTVFALLTVERGPWHYAYPDLKLILTSPCEFDNYQATGTLQIADTINLSVFFKEPCTQVSIAVPEPNWLINKASNNKLDVTLIGYNRNNPALQKLELQTRRLSLAGRPATGNSLVFENEDERNSYFSSLLQSMKYPTGEELNYDFESMSHLKSLTEHKAGGKVTEDDPTPWFTVAEIPIAQIIDDYHIVRWNLLGEPDGTYEIRALAKCSAGNIDGVSARVAGFIDRTSPKALGLPEPVDNVLNADDQIKVTFTEEISCAQIDPLNNIQLINTQTGNPVVFNFTCNGNSIAITPQGSYAPYENKVLKAVVKRIKDLNGNTLEVPRFGQASLDSLAWEFLVDRNPVRWAGGEIDLVKYVDETIDIQRTLQNTGAFNQTFSLIDVPSWLITSATGGSIQIQSSTTLNFRFSSQMSPGTYNDTIYAQTIGGDEPLIIKIRVLCRPPVWEVDPAQFQYSMNFIAQLFVDTVASEDKYDRIGAYVNGQLRGVAEIQYIQQLNVYRAFLTVYSNNLFTETVTFRVWDASTCTEYGEAQETFPFLANTIQGTYSNPVRITATPQIIQNYFLKRGWTWMSFNTKVADMSVNNFLSGIQAVDGDMIKDQIRFSQYYSVLGWVGELDSMTSKTMYMIKLENGDTLNRVGYAVDPARDTIQIKGGWSWIGYTPQFDLPVNYALGSFPAQDGNLIKSQSQFAVYAQGIGWIGNLMFMRPKEGYLFRTDVWAPLVYPRTPPNNAPAKADSVIEYLPELPEWIIARESYQFNMPVIARVEGTFADSINKDDVLGLFAEGECRGLVKPVINPKDNKYWFFALAYSNIQSGEVITFRLFRKETGKVHTISSTVVFNAQGITGSVDDPVYLPVSVTSAESEELLPKEFSLAQNYPNPFNPVTTIRYALPKESEVVVEVYTVMGELVRTLVNGTQPAGYHNIIWDAKDNSGKAVTSGIYFYTMKSGEFKSSRKLVLLK